MFSLVYEFIGVCFRWFFLNTKRRLKGDSTLTFREVWDGKNDDPANDLAYALGNIVIGSLLILIIVLLIKWFDEGRI